jgi:YesN/AraC family two-component response regulator
VREAEDGVAALKAGDEAPPDILVADYSMPGMNGVQLAQYARDIWPNLPVIIVSGYSDAEAVKGALPGAALLWKPFSAGELLLAVGKALPRKVPA